MATTNIQELLTQGLFTQPAQQPTVDPRARLTGMELLTSEALKAGDEAAGLFTEGGNLLRRELIGLTPEEETQENLMQDVSNFDNLTTKEQEGVVLGLQALGETAMAGQLASHVKANLQKVKTEAEAAEKATRTSKIRQTIVERMGEDSRFADIKPLVAVGAFDSDFSSIIKTLTQPSGDKKLGKLYSATDSNGNDIIVSVQSQKGKDDKLMTIDGNPIPKGTVLKAGGTKVAVNLNNEEETALNKELGKLKAKAVMSSYEEATKAQVGSQVIDDQWDIISSQIGVISGTAADFKLGAAKALKAVGLIGGDDSDTDELIANTETYISNAGNLVARVIKEFGAGTGLSDADRDFAQGIVAGRINLDAKSMKRLIKLQARAVRRQIGEHNKKVSKLSPDNQATLSVKVPEFSWAYDQPQEAGIPSDIQNILDELTPSGPQ